MAQINNITASILQTPAALQLQDADKTRQIRHTRDIRKNTATSDEAEVEESVTSTDEVQPAADEHHDGGKQKKGAYSRNPKPDAEEPSEGDHLDLCA